MDSLNISGLLRTAPMRSPCGVVRSPQGVLVYYSNSAFVTYSDGLLPLRHTVTTAVLSHNHHAHPPLVAYARRPALSTCAIHPQTDEINSVHQRPRERPQESTPSQRD